MTPWSLREHPDRKPSPQAVSRAEDAVVGAGGKEGVLEGLLPHLPTPGCHGDGLRPLKGVLQAVAAFAGKSGGCNVAPVGGSNVGHCDHVHALSDLVQNSKAVSAESQH